VKRLAGICLFESVCFAVLSQTGPVPARWTGAWVLNIQKSTFGEILIPGVPVDLKIIRQTVGIEQTATDIRISGDTVVSDGSGSHSAHEDNRLKFDGTAAIIGPASLSFRRIDDFAFDILSALNIPDHNLSEVSRFVFSPDGRSLTETKTQTEREGERTSHPVRLLRPRKPCWFSPRSVRGEGAVIVSKLTLCETHERAAPGDLQSPGTFFQLLSATCISPRPCFRASRPKL